METTYLGTTPTSDETHVPSVKRLMQSLRWPAERRMLWLTLAMVGLVTFIFTPLSAGGLMLALAGLLFVAWVVIRIRHAGLIGSAARISTWQIPRLGRLFLDCAWRVQPPLVQGFVAQNPALNAYAFGLGSPQAIVLFSGLVEHLDDDELRFVIGHEMGHVLFRHTRLGSLIGGLAGVPGVPFLSDLVEVAFLGWSRCAEFSADRAGLIACGRLDKAQSAIVKLMVGPTVAALVKVEELEKQADELGCNPLGWLGQLGHSHPFSVYRLRELRKFAESEQYAEIFGAQAKGSDR